ncbi:Membrane protein involved in the export of O-antigen and teichoic acid [Hymenobacter gelipurpurascens]|uniref:Membrane protein involved in the export of O-antigen and teichoic acid n=1 Tax=Hymenobacter gelipurpurascens TaxID=89968 RepID=A0A212UGY2_9BACT|nr:hypothetical protein [Hymenobacter gelipurpurascens]SNC77528.1 Membrane protein involved in the export of O-antigen and teichoic acid [Hymenobacter gelipurpurascens]
MSTASRLVSGAAISWIQIIVNVISQLALVPIMLSHWSVASYGIWLAVQSLITLMSVLDLGHHEYLTYEFMRIGTAKLSDLSKYLWSGMLFSFLISLSQVMVFAILWKINSWQWLFGDLNKDNALIEQGSILLLLYSVNWCLSFSLLGLIYRVLLPFGYYTRMAWWNLFTTTSLTIITITAIVLGANILVTGTTITVCSTSMSILVYVDLAKKLKKEGILFSSPSWHLGLNNFLNSLVIASKGVLENVRQQGVRLFLPKAVGVSGLATFSTIKTGSNLALQGLNTVIQPLMPELMRFLHQRDQARLEAAFGTVWVIVVGLMAPAIVILQFVVEPLYTLWTRGQVPFNPSLFALLTAGVLVFAVAQPAVAVVKGNNLLRPQLLISFCSAALIVIGVPLCLPIAGLIGVGVLLLAAELVAAFCYIAVAVKWLKKNALQWPSASFTVAVISVAIAIIANLMLVWLPAMKWITLMLSLALLLINSIRFWRRLPDIATQRVRSIYDGWRARKRLMANA